ncbi:MAG: protein kinase [Myxococcota bacterium]
MPGALEPGALVDRYRILGLLGSGGMADVYLVEHAELRTRHALKVLKVAVPGLDERLVMEGRLQASLRHPNVVNVTDIVRIDGTPGLVMEHVRGPALDRLLSAYPPNLQQIDAIARGILEGVAAAHARGTVHRDLKPSNVLVAVEAGAIVPKVADFGLAKALLAEDEPSLKTRSGATLGTPTFMAPEQFRSAKGVDHRADIFSLGAVLYELVSGVPAFSGNDLIAIYDQTSSAGYRKLREVAPNVPERMEKAISAALQPDPDARPQTVAALLELWVSGAEAPVQPWETSHVSLVSQLAPDVELPSTDTLDAGAVTPAMALQPPTPDAPAPRRLREPLEPAGPSGRAWVPIAVVLALLVAGGGVLGLGTLGLAFWLAPVEPSTPDPEPIAIAPDPEPGVPDPDPEPVPQPSTPRPTGPRPVSPPPRPVEPAPADPVPEPGPDSPPDVEPTETPAPEGLANATVVLEGVSRGFLIDRDTQARHPIGAVPAGVYNLYVYFDEREPTRVLLLRLAPGDTRTIRCHEEFCR